MELIKGFYSTRYSNFRYTIALYILWLVVLTGPGCTGLALADGLWGDSQDTAATDSAPTQGVIVQQDSTNSYFPDAVFNLGNQKYAVLSDGGKPAPKDASNTNDVYLGIINDSDGKNEKTISLALSADKNRGNQYAPKAFLSNTNNGFAEITVAWFGQPTKNSGNNFNVFIQKYSNQKDPDQLIPQWRGGIPIQVYPNGYDQNKVVLESDGKRGTFICWQEKNPSWVEADNQIVTHYTIRVCYIKGNEENNVEVLYYNSLSQPGILNDKQDPNDQFLPQMVSDGSDGVYLAWSERVHNAAADSDSTIANHNYDPNDSERSKLYDGDKIYARHLSGMTDKNKVPTLGKLISFVAPLDTTYTDFDATTTEAQFSPALLADKKSMNVWMVWVDRRYKSDKDGNKQADKFVFQKIRDSNGAESGEWGTSLGTTQFYPFIKKSPFDPEELRPRIISDGAGGVLIVWSCKDTDYYNKIYMQHVDNAGNSLRRRVCSYEMGNQNLPDVVLTSSGKNILIAWEDWRGVNSCQIYTQKIDLDGNMLWRPAGVSIAYTNPWSCYKPCIAADSNDGAVVAWQKQKDFEDYPRACICAQLIDRPNAYVTSAVANISSDNAYAVLDIQGDDFWDESRKVITAILTLDNHPNITSSHVILNKKTNLTAYFNLNLSFPVSTDWRVRLLDNKGYKSSNSLVTVSLPGIKNSIPYARPNPFLPGLGQTCLLYTPRVAEGEYKLEIFNLKGRLLRTLESSGEWDGKDGQGRTCESGLYFYQINAAGRRWQGSVTLVR